MGWVWLLIAIVALVLFASFRRKQRRRGAVAAMRRHFPRLVRMRLVAACPGLDGVLDEASLRLIFDWILIEMHRRTGTSGLDGLMRWSIKNGEAESERLTAEVSRHAVDWLPQPALAAIDQCQGRTFAAVIIDEALTESGQRAAPELKQRR